MDETSKLEAEYCPPIDPALLFAIVSDFNLSTTKGETAARETLDQLKESALLEDGVDFDPSGVSKADEKDRSTLLSDELHSALTDDTSVSNDLASLSIVDVSNEHDEHNLENHDDETKLLLLYDVFGEQVSERTIKDALKKCNGNWNAAMEELLNQVYFNDAEHSDTGEKLAAKGIDGFAEERISRRRKRRRNRNSRMSESADSSLSESSVASAPSKWQSAKSEVDFISSRMNISSTAVRMAYNTNGASLSRTINVILKEEMKEHKDSSDEQTVRLAKELSDDFPTIAEPYLLAIIRITQPSTANAHEIAKALVARPTTQSSGRIVPQYARLTDDDIEGSSWPSASARKPAVSSVSMLGAESYAVARAQAFAQASAAHRKAKSDRLMGGAAAYYSQLGRDYSSLSHSATASAADTLANSQSSALQVDLHGVDVLNGVRIAKEKVERWWSSLGESRANGRLGASQRSEAYRVIVGLGRHSEGGKGKLGPAVTKMLRSEGWKFENEGAIIAVSGKQKL